jgi:hypothetical protein
VERGPLSLEKPLMEYDLLVYTTKDGATHEFDGVEFLALLPSHISNTYESIIRFYGWYSCRKREERKNSQLSKKLMVPQSSYQSRAVSPL